MFYRDSSWLWASVSSEAGAGASTVGTVSRNCRAGNSWFEKKVVWRSRGRKFRKWNEKGMQEYIHLQNYLSLKAKCLKVLLQNWKLNAVLSLCWGVTYGLDSTSPCPPQYLWLPAWPSSDLWWDVIASWALLYLSYWRWQPTCLFPHVSRTLWISEPCFRCFFFFSACFLIKQSSSFTVCVYCFFSARLNVNFTRLRSLFVCTRCIGWYHRCPMYSCWVEMLFDTVSTHFGILVILFYFLAYLGFCVTNATCIMSEQYHTISTM